ncbi:ATP-binding protein [Streptomyces fructofermentans]|uniref:ATP-binding protein n=1 Tax=Streptomyces fructofermentans TaxID=152141 RepID=UPI0037A5A18D
MDGSSEDGDGGLCDALPLEAALALDGEGSRIAQARHLAVAFLGKVKDCLNIPVATATVEIVQLIVSELVTNARKYAPGPALLQLRVVAGPVLQVELWDSNPVAPVAKALDPRRIGQHGLEIVTALARTVTVEQTPVGKRIIAAVPLDGAAA